MSSDDQQKPTSQITQHSSAGSGRVSRFLTASAIGGVLLGLCGMTLTGTVIGLIMTTPALVLFSPVLVPAGILLFLVAAGFLFAGGCGVAALAALLWIYNYVTGKHPPGMDYARMKERAKEDGNQETQAQDTAVEGS